jgi:hypothetical protein
MGATSFAKVGVSAAAVPTRTDPAAQAAIAMRVTFMKVS